MNTHVASDRETMAPGKSCELCGDDADFVRELKGHFEIAICEACDHDRVCECPDCHEFILQHNGLRVFNTSELYCLSCGYAYPHMGPDPRDEMNQRRR